MRQCPSKHKESPLKRPLFGRVVRSFEIQVAKTTNGQKNGSAEESTKGRIIFPSTAGGMKWLKAVFAHFIDIFVGTYNEH